MAICWKGVSTGLVTNVSQSIVCHDASTMGGFCGAVGVSINKCVGNNFSFIHSGTHYIPLREKLLGAPKEKEHNHALTVLDPDFKAAYEAYVIPFLQTAKLSEPLASVVKQYCPNL